MNAQRTLPLLFALASLGCVPDFEDNLSTIVAPRLLAIQAQPAEAEEGAEVELRALVAAPESEAVSRLRWSLCLTRKPLTELGPVSPDCLTVSDDGSGKVAELGSGLVVGGTLPQDACRLFGPSRPEPKPGELPGRPVDPDTTGGYYQPAAALLDDTLSIGSVRLSCGLTAANRSDILAYNAQYRPNENPRVARLDLGEAELAPAADAAAEPSASVQAGSLVTLRASWNPCPSEPACEDGVCSAYEDRINCPADCEAPHGCFGAEPYVAYDGENGVIEQRREALRLAWYASGGSFEQELTGREEGEQASDSSNTWTAPARAGVYSVWLVLRDSRGGSSWQHYRVEVRP